MASVDSAKPEQFDFVGSLLVADTRAFVEAWREVLSTDPSPSSPPVTELRERCKTLQLRARAASVGGLAHHLGVCNEYCEAWDRERLERCLANVLELAWQLSQEVERGRPALDAIGAEAVSFASESGEASVAAPTIVEHPVAVQRPLLLPPGPWRGWKGVTTDEVARSAAPPSSPEPVSESAPTVASPPPVSWSLAPVSVEALSIEAASEPSVAAEAVPVAPLSVEAVSVDAVSVEPPPRLSLELQAAADDDDDDEPVPSSRSVFAEPVLESGWADSPLPPALVQPPPLLPSLLLPKPPSQPQQPPLERLRPEPPRPARIELAARVAEAAARAAEPVPAPARIDEPARASEPKHASEPTQPPARLDEPAQMLPPAPVSDGVAALSEVLGLTPLGESLQVVSERALYAARQIPAPPRLGPDPSGLPLLEAESIADDELTDQELEIRLERVRRAAPFPLGRGERAIELPPPSEPRARRRTTRPRLAWWMTPLALGVFGGVALLALLLRPWRSDKATTPEAESTAVTQSQALLPVQRLTDDREVRLTLLALVQGGGKESNELSDLIREEVALVAKALVEPCMPGSPSCRIAEQARQMLAQPPLPKPAERAPSMPGNWLEGLRQPLIGVKDDPRVKKLVDYHTNDPVGRELFQGLLFRCGAFQSQFSDTLMQHGLPLDLIAVPMVESGCLLDAESPVGARGLWQFMPATARAYHLRVQPGVLDERLNPTKSTDAALEFLRDLRSKLGSWELAFASYNMGPFALVSRMNQAGAGVDFWDLVDAQRLPQETANYVPKIEAFALILANLEHFRFDAAQQMVETAATTLLVPAGTRLGQVARAVGSSASRIRELNPDLLAETVPGATGEEFSLRVPSDGAPKARELLERLVARADDADECVPSNFDWGKQRLTKAMQNRCKR